MNGVQRKIAYYDLSNKKKLLFQEKWYKYKEEIQAEGHIHLYKFIMEYCLVFTLIFIINQSEFQLMEGH